MDLKRELFKMAKEESINFFYLMLMIVIIVFVLVFSVLSIFLMGGWAYRFFEGAGGIIFGLFGGLIFGIIAFTFDVWIILKICDKL